MLFCLWSVNALSVLKSVNDLFTIRHYKQAYGHILELRMLDTNLLEVKTVAGFINYKVSFSYVL